MRRLILGALALGIAISLSVAYAQQQTAGDSAEHKVWTAKEGEWMPLPDIFPSGGQMKVMNGDPSKGPADMYFRFPAGYEVPWHFHTPNERLFGDKGTIEFEMKDGMKASLGEGSYMYFPSKAPHRAKCVSTTECVFYLTSSDVFDVHLVEPSTWSVSKSWSAATGKTPS